MFFPEYQTTASIFRLDEESGKREWVDTYETASLFLQPAGTEDVMVFEGDFSKSFVAYTKAGNIEQTDRLVIDGVIHEIRSIQKFGFGTSPYWKVFLEKSK